MKKMIGCQDRTENGTGMTHDPLCLGSRLPEDMNWPARCDCELIAKVREDMLAKCIAAVDAAVAEWEGEWSIDDIYRALCALQEKP
jgi:hypothetical protein